ncbi:hypothetical protein EX895_002992 [Sporisorium graminicola]|uniref:Uncharacterized protein n=1 Tax=Sporisorium graminicola TaxID=280036 RepID=A0A4U7KTM9_9BASI|nr:hypothetical protein EX895_002987 [Sporisorium graminicola]XP_029739881.1 hypothetical protein EX895_002992 [Sporisorium graminicola]TKY87891.1 hypothetical protein EX895_002987 [Sporisorium graminicola]TKY87896.1 hypothetical protein EX895_002992 [Sporisorium graminicola]
MFGAGVVGPGSGLRNLALQARRPQSASAASESQAGGQFEDRNGAVDDDGVSPMFDEYIFRARQDLIDRRRSKAESVDPRGDEGWRRWSYRLRFRKHQRGRVTTKRTTRSSPRAIMIDEDIEAGPASPELSSTSKGVDANLLPQITTTDLGLTLVVDIPASLLLGISLPLFLGVNLVTFLASIKLVPARIRRYAHPILTTSVATVLLLWRRRDARVVVEAHYSILLGRCQVHGPVVAAWVHGACDRRGPCAVLDAGCGHCVAGDPHVPAQVGSVGAPGRHARRAPAVQHAEPVRLAHSRKQDRRRAPRALAFASRFMSTPLAIELSLTIGADESLTVVLVVITGILFSIFKTPSSACLA